MDTVLCAGNTALVVSCPLSTGEFATKMPPRRALKGKEGEGVKLAQRGEETYLVRQAKE